MIKDDEQLRNADLAIWLSLKIKFEKITTATPCRPSAIHRRDHEDHQDDDAHPEGESSAKRHKTSELGTYSMGKSSSGHAMKQEQEPNMSGLGSVPFRRSMTLKKQLQDAVSKRKKGLMPYARINSVEQ
ncbi:hypothetical protein Tco_1027779 [Tanacetum coccineum]